MAPADQVLAYRVLGAYLTDLPPETAVNDELLARDDALTAMRRVAGYLEYQAVAPTAKQFSSAPADVRAGWTVARVAAV